MELIQDVKVFCESRLHDPNRVVIADGSQRVSKLNGLPCIPHTYIQSTGWRNLTNNEQAKVFDLEPDNYKHGNSIRLIEIPELYIEAIHTLILKKIDHISSDEELEVIQSDVLYTNFIDFLSGYLRQNHLILDQDFKIFGLETNPKGLLAVSYDPTNECYVGLHVDNWDKEKIYQRYNSRSLFCLNLGYDDRFIMYVNLGFNNVCSLLNEKMQFTTDFTNYEPDELVYKFLDNFPKYPILKLRIKPREAYIFPIQNVIHEGVTTDKSFNDVNLMALGFIN